MNLTRRSFVAASTAALLTTATRVRGANDDIRVAIIGVNGKGKQHISNFSSIPGVRIVALCDADAAVLAARAKLVDNPNLKTVTDLRDIFDDKDIDAVVVAMPNHWHALATIWACQAGKDVYCEKPCSYNIWEGQQMIAAARKYDRIVQIGTQRRSDQHLAEAFNQIQSGKFGSILHTRVLHYGVRQGIGQPAKPQAAPDSVDFNLWAGPSSLGPIQRQKFHYDWHWFWDTGNGELGNNGPHHLDLARWVNNYDALPPRVISLGARLGWQDNGQTPNTHIIYYDYPAPIIAEFRNLSRETASKSPDAYRGANLGVIVQCENAYFSGLNGGAFYDNDGKRIAKVDGDGGRHHPANFITAVRAHNRKLLNCDVQEGHRSTSLCHIGNVSHKLGQTANPNQIADSLKANPLLEETYQRTLQHLAKHNIDTNAQQLTLGPLLEINPKKERFINTPQAKAANALMRRQYRHPFVINKTV